MVLVEKVVADKVLWIVQQVSLVLQIWEVAEVVLLVLLLMVLLVVVVL